MLELSNTIGSHVGIKNMHVAFKSSLFPMIASENLQLFQEVLSKVRDLCLREFERLL